jgi:hypothetical protein
MSKPTTKTSENRVSTLAYQAENARAQRAYTVSYAFQKLEALLTQPYQNKTEQYVDQYAGNSSNNLGVKVVQKLETSTSPTYPYNYSPKTFDSTINPDHIKSYESSQTPVQAPAAAIETALEAQPSEILDQARAVADARSIIDDIHNNPLFKVNNG